MTDQERRLREAEALSLLTNRILMDFLSLNIDSGAISLDGVKHLIGLSASEVVRGAPGYADEVRFYERNTVDRLTQTFTPK